MSRSVPNKRSRTELNLFRSKADDKVESVDDVHVKSNYTFSQATQHLHLYLLLCLAFNFLFLLNSTDVLFSHKVNVSNALLRLI